MTGIVLVRHGQTEWNLGDKFRGRADIALNKTGVRQAELVAEKLSAWNVAALYSSPLRRALMTAEIIGQRLGLPVQPLNGLTDIDFGAWQGLSPEGAMGDDRELYTRWLEQPQEVHFPHGESLQDVRGRVMAAFDSLMERHSEQTVVLISHNVVCRVLVCAVLGLDDSHLWQVGQDVAAINVFELWGGRVVLSLLNDTCHLKRLGL